jgi:hypothetical protein
MGKKYAEKRFSGVNIGVRLGRGGWGIVFSMAGGVGIIFLKN